MRLARRVACMGWKRNAYRAVVGKRGGQRPFGRCRSRREDNIKMDLSEMGCEGLDWINVTHDRNS